MCQFHLLVGCCCLCCRDCKVGKRRSERSLVWHTSDVVLCNEMLEDTGGALQRYVGSGRVPSKNIGASAKR
jgi:hypothetical protein